MPGGEAVMNSTFVARQPILNGKRQTLGFELLFRDGENNAFPTHIDPDRATYRLIAENFLSAASSPSSARCRCFINFPHKSLLRRLPLTLPKEQIVVEVLETCVPDDELLAAIRELNGRGYIIALDDFIYAPEWERFLPYIHIVKLDIMALGVAGACQMVEQRLQGGSRRRFLAERVETQEQFEQTRRAGFSFFQGYFFSKPQLSRQRYVSPEQVLAMQLFHEVCRSDVDFARVERIIAQDVALSYKLLRFVNGLSLRLAAPIHSFRQALIYLGQERLKLFVSLTVASYISASKPQALFNLALQRAQFCQLMAARRSLCEHKEQAFLIGLFSLLDALFDTGLPELLDALPLADSMKLALAERSGPLGGLLNLEECFEQADWPGVEACCRQLGCSLDEVNAAHSEAQQWSHALNRLD